VDRRIEEDCMEGETFDTLVRRAASGSTRRGIMRAGMGALTASLLTALGLAHPDDAAAESGKCKNPCGECQQCNRGKCRKKKNGKKKCRNGKCQPVSDGTICSGGSCRGGTCVPNPPAPSFSCPNVGTACGLGTLTAICQCALTTEGTQRCANFVNPPNGVAFQQCQQSVNCPNGQVCTFNAVPANQVCRFFCQTG
jgi:hypothetical protein